MSEPTITAGRRHRQADQPGTPPAPPAPPAPPELTAEEKAAAEKAAAEKAAEEKAEADGIAAIKGYTVASADFAAVTAPVRNRKPLQREMDTVAEKAYADWIAADRPTAWVKIPVMTYFLDPEDVSDYRKMIKKACELAIPQDYTGEDGATVKVSGVRPRFGKEFVLTEATAKRAGIDLEKVGKTVLAWAAVDKRQSGKGNGDS